MKPSSFVREIPITDVPGLRIGHAENEEAKTGVTVLIFDQGATAGVDISGGGPASRETPLASPVTADNPLNAIVLSGGSAFGLAAGDGVMRYLEEHDMGYPTGFANVPLVCQSCIYDLGMGRADIRPDAAMATRPVFRQKAGSKMSPLCRKPFPAQLTLTKASAAASEQAAEPLSEKSAAWSVP